MNDARPRTRAILSHRAWTYSALFCTAAAALGILYFDVLVALRVDCRSYNGSVSAAVQWFGAATFYLALPLLMLNVVRGVLVRSVPVALLSLGLAGAGAGVFLFSIDYIFAYCLLDGVKLSPCLLGCPH